MVYDKEEQMVVLVQLLGQSAQRVPHIVLRGGKMDVRHTVKVEVKRLGDKTSRRAMHVNGGVVSVRHNRIDVLLGNSILVDQRLVNERAIVPVTLVITKLVYTTTQNDRVRS